jgi:hypothetical protein
MGRSNDDGSFEIKLGVVIVLLAITLTEVNARYSAVRQSQLEDAG